MVRTASADALMLYVHHLRVIGESDFAWVTKKIPETSDGGQRRKSFGGENVLANSPDASSEVRRRPPGRSAETTVIPSGSIRGVWMCDHVRDRPRKRRPDDWSVNGRPSRVWPSCVYYILNTCCCRSRWMHSCRPWLRFGNGNVNIKRGVAHTNTRAPVIWCRASRGQRKKKKHARAANLENTPRDCGSGTSWLFESATGTKYNKSRFIMGNEHGCRTVASSVEDLRSPTNILQHTRSQ